MTHHYVQAKYFGVNEVSAVLGIIFFTSKVLLNKISLYCIHVCV